MLSKELELCFNLAVKKANELSHEYLTCELIFWSLLSRSEIKEVLINIGVELQQLSEELELMLSQKDGFSILTNDQKEQLSQKQFADPKFREMARRDGITFQPELSLAVQKTLQNAAIHIQSSGQKKISTLSFLVSIFVEDNRRVFYLLNKYGADRLVLLEEISHGSVEIGSTVSQEKPKALELFTLNLSQKAKEGLIDPIIGRKNELRSIARILCMRSKNNPLLIGDSGVGKTAIAEGLARLIHEGNVPLPLRDSTVFLLNLTDVISGAKYRGDFEKRLKNIIEELLVHKKEGKKPIIIIDEIHTLIGAGSVGGGAMDASNILKPALARGDIRCIGSTTFEEYRKHIEKDHAFNRRFQEVIIEELSLAETMDVISGIKGIYENFHQIKFSEEVLKLIIDLAHKYLPEKRFPDKAINIMDELGANRRVSELNYDSQSITIKEVEDLISIKAKVPVVQYTNNDSSKLLDLSTLLKSKIFGQDQAIDSISDVILISRSGLKGSEGPLGSFLFTGPTGVGKTELAKQLAYLQGVHFERFDMSEYMEKHSVAKLIGSPPGYVGFEAGGLLTDIMKKHPNCVLLLDEIEKAHHDVINILLQIMDHGTLTDSHGRVSSFKNCVLIMTSNVGAKEMEIGSIGLNQAINDSQSSKSFSALKNIFTPEFRNRLDAIIRFNRLNHAQILLVVEKFLSELVILVEKQGYQISFDQELKEWIVEKGFSAHMGARPIARFINSEIKKPLANHLLMSKISKGALIRVSFDFNKPVFSF